MKRNVYRHIVVYRPWLHYAITATGLIACPNYKQYRIYSFPTNTLLHEPHQHRDVAAVSITRRNYASEGKSVVKLTKSTTSKRGRPRGSEVFQRPHVRRFYRPRGIFGSDDEQFNLAYTYTPRRI